MNLIIIFFSILLLLPFNIISQTWELFNTENSGILSNNINSLDVNRDGNVFLSTNEGISIFKDGEWINFDNEVFKQGADLPHISVLDSIFYFSNGKVDGIYRGNINNWELYLENENARTLEVIDHNYLLFSDRYYLYNYQNGLLTQLDSVQFINDILYRKNGEIWFSAIHDGSGLYKLGSGKIDLGEKFMFSSINSLVEDKNNFNWLTTNGPKSILKLDSETKSYELFDSTNTPLKDTRFIYDIQVDSSNNIWVLIKNSLPIGSTLLKYNHIEWIEYNIKEQLPEDAFFILNSFVIDKDNNIWIATIGNDIGLIKFNEKTTYVETSEENQIKIYPNPVKDKLSLDLDNGHIISYSITDIIGRRVLNSNELIPNLNTIDVSSLTSGSYFIKFELANGETSSVKFVKE